LALAALALVVLALMTATRDVKPGVKLKLIHCLSGLSSTSQKCICTRQEKKRTKKKTEYLALDIQTTAQTLKRKEIKT